MSCRFVLISGFSLLALTHYCAPVHAEPTISLKIVGVNDTLIVPSGNVQVAPGDRVFIEIYLSGWGPRELYLYQVAIPLSNFQSSETGVLSFVEVACGIDNRCRFSTTTSWPCLCIDYCPGLPCLQPFIQTSHARYVFKGIQNIPAADTSGDPIRFAAVVFSDSGKVDPGYPMYAGTLVMDVSEDAAGMFTITPVADRSFMADVAYNDVGPIEFGSLVISVPPVVCAADADCDDAIPCTADRCIANACRFVPVKPILIASDPPSCGIDARQPIHLDGSSIPSARTVRLTFDSLSECVSPWDFEVTTSGAEAPSVMAVTADGGGVIVELDRASPPGRWTCITHLPSEAQTCMGFLPGDVDGDGTAGSPDIIRLVDHLNGSDATLMLHQCDLDRSGVCSAPDIVRLIDLLIGAGSFQPWMGRTLGSCPSAP